MGRKKLKKSELKVKKLTSIDKDLKKHALKYVKANKKRYKNYSKFVAELVADATDYKGDY